MFRFENSIPFHWYSLFSERKIYGWRLKELVFVPCKTLKQPKKRSHDYMATFEYHHIDGKKEALKQYYGRKGNGMTLYCLKIQWNHRFHSDLDRRKGFFPIAELERTGAWWNVLKLSTGQLVCVDMLWEDLEKVNKNQQKLVEIGRVIRLFGR